MSMDVSKLDGGFVGNVKKHEWTNAMLNELVKWERMLINPKPEVSHLSDWHSPKGQHNMHPTCLDMISSESGYNLIKSCTKKKKLNLFS